MKVLLKKYLDGKATLEEQKLIDEWYESLSSEEDNILSSEERVVLREGYWSILRERIRQTGPSSRILWPKILGIAASITAIMMVSIFYFESNVVEVKLTGGIPTESVYDVSNKSGVVRKVMLPDSSEVELFPGSTLKLAGDFNVHDRRVTLSGQAIFDVTRKEDKPFFVYANEVITEVLGTRFTVTAFADDPNITVAVKSGKVSVYTQSAKDSGLPQREKIILTPNHQAVYKRVKHEVSRALVAEPELIISEEEVKNIRFEGESVYTVFKAIEKMYGVEIDFDEDVFSKCLITTSVSGEDLYGRISVICNIAGATYKIEDTKIVVTGSGCN